MNFALLFALLTVAEVTPPTIYESEHFHYFDEQGQVHGVPLQNKIFVEGGEKVIKELEKEKLITSASLVPYWGGFVLTTANKEDALSLLNSLSGKYRVYPVLMWEGIEVIPRPSILIQVHPSVTELLLRQRIESVGKLALSTVNKLDADHYAVSFASLTLPPNILVLANLLAGDKAWVKWARPDFQPLYGKVAGRMFVTTPGDTNLGEMRQLVLVIDVYDSRVKIRTDLLPALGQGGLVIQPLVEDIWMDASPPVTKVQKGLHKTTYTITYAFRYCRPGDQLIQSFRLAYEEDGKAKFVFLEPTTFKAPPALNDSIDDIQPIAEQSLLTNLPMPDAPVSSFLDRPYFKWAGWGLLFFSALIFVGLVTNLTGRATKNWWMGLMGGRQREALWGSLWRSTKDLTTEKDWRKSYQNVAYRFTDVLTEFYGVSCLPSALSWHGNKDVKVILEELENLYKKEAKPDLKRLSGAIRAFYKHREYNV